VIEAMLRGGPSLDAGPVSRKVTGTGPVIDQEARFFCCVRCEREVCICAACDRGQVACPDCRPLRRRESMQLAGAKYQRGSIGARKHAARQKKCAAKLSAHKVTHHAFPIEPPSTMVAESSAPVLAPADLRDRDGTVADHAADCGH